MQENDDESGLLSDERAEDNFTEDELQIQSIENTAIEDDITLAAHLRCCSHTLSLVATCDSKNVSNKGSYGKLRHSMFAKCSALWNSAGRPKSSEKIRKILDCQLKLPCATRWNSLYDSLGNLLKHKDKLNELLIELHLPSFRETELEFMEEYLLVLQPIAAALDRLQADKDCYYGCVIPTLLATEKKFNRLNSNALHHCQPLLNAILEGFHRRFSKFLLLDPPTELESKTAVLATVSNPQFKLKWLTIHPKNNTLFMKKMVQEMLLTAIRNCGCSSVPDCNNADQYASSSDEFFGYEQVDENTKCTAGGSKDEMEILRYFGDNRTSVASLEDYPKVKQVFLKYNTPLPSSAPVERLFSFAGHIFSPKRGKLSDKMFEKLIFLKGNSAYVNM